MFMYKQDLHSQYKSFHSVSLQKTCRREKEKEKDKDVTENHTEMILCCM